MLLLSVVCLSIAQVACRKSSPPTGYAGTWVMKVGQRVFGVLIIEEKRGTYTGNWTLPEHFGLGMGKLAAFSHVTAQTKRTTFATMTVQGDHLHFVVPDPDAPAEPDEFDMSLVNSNQAVVRFVGVPIEPWPFSRVQDGTVPAVATDWEPQRSYPLKEETFTSNAEMLAIFAEDQKVRQGEISEAQWVAISKEDAVRRERTRSLLAREQLHTSEDFREAAFVFQHGDSTGRLSARAHAGDGRGWERRQRGSLDRECDARPLSPVHPSQADLRHSVPRQPGKPADAGTVRPRD